MISEGAIDPKRILLATAIPEECRPAAVAETAYSESNIEAGLGYAALCLADRRGSFRLVRTFEQPPVLTDAVNVNEHTRGTPRQLKIEQHVRRVLELQEKRYFFPRHGLQAPITNLLLPVCAMTMLGVEHGNTSYVGGKIVWETLRQRINNALGGEKWLFMPMTSEHKGFEAAQSATYKPYAKRLQDMYNSDARYSLRHTE